MSPPAIIGPLVSLDLLDAAVAVLDASGTITGWNLAAAERFRRSGGEAVGQPWDAVIALEPVGTFAAAVTGAGRGETACGDAVACVPAAPRQLIRWSVRPFETAGDGAVLCQFRDDAEHFRRLLWERNTVDYRMALPSGRFQYLSPELEGLTGHRPAAFYEDAALVTRCLVEPWEAYFREELERLRAGQDPVDYEYQVRDASGEIRWLLQRSALLRDHSGAVVALEGLVEDVTERKQAEQDLVRTQERYRSTLDGLGVAIHVLDTELRVVLINDPMRQWLERLGLDSDVTSRAVQDAFPFLGPWALEEYRQVRLTGETLVTEEENRLGEQVIYTETRKVPLLEDGVVKRIISLVRDTTERKQVDRQRDSLLEQLRQSQKMEAIGRLAGGVAHDFNNLLTGIQGYAELITMALSPAHPVQSDVEEIRKATERAAGLTQQLLAFSRKQVISPQVININDALLDTEKLLGRILGEDIELVVRPAPRLGNVRADAHQLEQVLVNLVANARDAMPNGGKLRIETSELPIGEGVNIGPELGLPPGVYVVLAVTDDGMGMSEEVCKRVFEPFFTTKEKTKGTGLGLATVYGIIHQNQGAIHVDSALDVGTTFRVYLPRVTARKRPVSRESQSVLPIGSETILLVEDEATVRRLARRVLRGQGYRVITAVDGVEALETYGGLTEPIDLLLTDVIMPRMNGQQLSEHLKARQPALPVLFISGYTEDVIARHGVLEEGVRFLQKPFRTEQLVAKVRSVLDEKPKRKRSSVEVPVIGPGRSEG